MTHDTSGSGRGGSRVSGSRRVHASVLERSDYVRAFDVLEDCIAAPTLYEFKGLMLEALGRHFNLKHVSFFAGATFHNVFGDAEPLVEGNTRGMLPEWQDRWARYDIFGTPAAMRQLYATGASSIHELVAAGPLAPTAEAYVRHFLHATWHWECAAAMQLTLPGGHTALVGMFDTESERIGPSEMASLRLLSSQLSAISRRLPVQGSSSSLAGLSERQRQVADLVAMGLTNAQIAETLTLAEDSVKKYVTRILAATGCQTRMDLALLVRAS